MCRIVALSSGRSPDLELIVVLGTHALRSMLRQCVKLALGARDLSSNALECNEIVVQTLGT